MKKSVLISVFIIIFVGFISNSYAYSDVENKYWAKETIEFLSENGVLSGYPDGTFKPENNITVAEFTTLLMKIIEPNADVCCDSGYWASGVIKLAKEKKILIEEEYGEFDPDKSITRREICLMIYRSFDKLSEIDVEKLVNKKNFVDIIKNTEEEKILDVLSHIGILAGYPDGSIRLDKFSSRAETCCFIYNLIKFKPVILGLINDNEKIAYRDDIAFINKEKLPYELKKWNYSIDIPYITTEITKISLFPFNEPASEYKALFEDICSSEERYMQYRKRFGEGNYVIAVEFETRNNTSEYEVYGGHEFLHVSFPEEEISIIDSFDISEITRQLSGDASVGQIVEPVESLDTSAFYVVDCLPDKLIRLDRYVLDLYNIQTKQYDDITSCHSLLVGLGGV